MTTEGRLIDGRFKLLRLIHDGHETEVWEAEAGDQLVAVKILLNRNELVVQRFLEVHESLERLRLEGIPRRQAWGALEEGLAYVVTELLPGKSLAQLLRDSGRFEQVGAAVSYVMQACAVLAPAHDAGIVHRDIRPDNLLLDERSGSIKVLDFGNARQTGRRLTTPNTKLGDCRYAAPEQLRDASSAGPTADIWSLGVTLFELLTGTLPYPEINGPSATAGVNGTAPALDSLRSDIDAGLAACVACCLELDPRLRYSSVDALGRALAPFAESATPAVSELPTFHTAADLVEAVARPRTTADGRTRRVTFLLGAGVSAPARGRGGVPGTREIIELISEELDAEDRKTLQRLLRGPKNKYQVAFDFLLATSNAGIANTVIRKAVLQAYRKGYELASAQWDQEAGCRRYEADLPAWELPEGLDALGQLVAEEQRLRERGDPAADLRFSGPHFTTNFDPLLAISILRHGGKCAPYVITQDYLIPEPQHSLCFIVHLHGRWSEGDTLHTTLGSPRRTLASSLRHHLRESVLVVLGYGGWTDVFMQTLAEVANDTDAVDILWGFYDEDPKQLVANNPLLLPALLPLRPRIRFYRGVDSNQFFASLLERLGRTKPEEQAAPLPASNPSASNPSASSPSAPELLATRQARPGPLAWARRGTRSMAVLGVLAALVLLTGAALVARSGEGSAPSVDTGTLQPSAPPRALPAEIGERPEEAVLELPATAPPPRGQAPSPVVRPVPAPAAQQPPASAFGFLHVSVPPEIVVPELSIALDGVPLPPASWNRPLRVKAGTHRLEARAPGRKSWYRYGLAVERGQVPAQVSVPALTPLGI